MLCLSDNQYSHPIIIMIDIDGEPTVNPDDATAAQILLPNNELMLVRCARPDIVEIKVN